MIKILDINSWYVFLLTDCLEFFHLIINLTVPTQYFSVFVHVNVTKSPNVK